jgi:glycosyltransferase involved in cell wall biosynthesis
MASHRFRIVQALEKNRLTTGSVVQMLAAAQGLAARGHGVTIVSRSGGDLEAACAGTAVRLHPLPLRSAFDLRSALALRRLLRSQAIDLIHVHKGRPHAIALMAAAGLGPRPVVVVNRGVSFPLDRWNRGKYRHPRIGAVVCVAEAVRLEVIRSGRLSPEKVRTIPAGTDLTRFDRSRIDTGQVRSELGLAPEQLLVAQVSVRDWKGWRELLAAFAAACTEHAGARLLLVGCEPEPERAKVLAAAGELGVSDLVLTLPYRSDLPEVLATCDVVVDASWHGTGITGVIREAMALKRAVIASDCGGNRELIVDQESGLLVPPRDVDALAAGLDRLLGSRSLRETMASAAHARVAEGFSSEVRLDRLERLYTELLHRSRQS